MTDTETKATQTDTAEQLAAGMAMTGEHELPADFAAQAFYSPRLREVAQAVTALRDAGATHDVENVIAWLSQAGKLTAVGGQGAVLELYVAGRRCTWRPLVEVWGEVADAWGTRRIREAVSGALAKSHLVGAEDLVGLIYQAMGQVQLSRGDSTQQIGAVVRDAIKAMQARSESGGLAGITTGIDDLDGILGGLAEGAVTILAGRPSMGKSALARTIADAANKAGHGVHVFSLEDTAETYGLRCLADHARTDLGDLRVIGPSTPRHVLESTMRAGNELYSRKGWLVDDSAGLSSGEISTRVRRYREQNATRLVVVDYVQLIREPGTKDKGAEVAMAAENLVRLARDERVAVLLLSQLSRKCEERPDRRPQLSDLRETGVLEQVAYAALLCFRPEVYMAKDAPDPAGLRGTGAAIVAKNKNGRTGEVWMQWDSPTATYRQLARRGL
jgi:replicative DNA helicase